MAAARSWKWDLMSCRRHAELLAKQQTGCNVQDIKPHSITSKVPRWSAEYNVLAMLHRLHSCLFIFLYNRFQCTDADADEK